MDKVRFIGDTDCHSVELKRVNENVLQIVFQNEDVPNTIGGFELLNEHNMRTMGDYSGYTTIYRTYEDIPNVIELSNDESVYVIPPETEPVPEPEPYVPTEEELAIILETSKKNKIAESKQLLATYLENNPIISTAHNNVAGVYSVTSDKQLLMMSQYMTYQIEKKINPDAVLTWNETGKSCEIWTEEEFLQLILEVKSYVYPLVSYQQKLEEKINLCTSQNELDENAISYYMIQDPEILEDEKEG